MHTLLPINSIHIYIKFIQTMIQYNIGSESFLNEDKSTKHHHYYFVSYHTMGEAIPCHMAKSKLIWEYDFSPPESDLESLCRVEPFRN